MTLVLILCGALGLVSIALVFAFRYVSHHFTWRGLGFGSLELFQFSSSSVNWKHLQFESTETISISHFPSLLFQVSGIRLHYYKFRISIEIDSIHLHINSIILKPLMSSKKNSKTSNSWLLKFIPRFELKCSSFNLYATTGNILDAETVSYIKLATTNLVLSKENSSLLKIESLKVEQIISSPNLHGNQHVLVLRNLSCNEIPNGYSISVSENVFAALNVTFLFFVSSFIKEVTGFDPEAPDDDFVEASLNSHPVSNHATLLTFFIPHFELKLILPETTVDSKVFEYVAFSLNNVSGSACVGFSQVPKFTLLSDSFRVSSKYERSELGEKYFCKIDDILNRGANVLASTITDLIEFKKVTLCNWSLENQVSRSSELSSDLIKNLFGSILKRTPLWQLDHKQIGEYEFKSHYAREKYNFPVDASFEASLKFYKSALEVKNSIFAQFDSVDALVPFEFPFSNLLDHAVILFKAGWRPLSFKTEKGFWSGDGDKFLKSPWSINLQSKIVRMRFEDDQFEVRLSTIYHCQRKVAEMRNRLEPELWEWPETDYKPTKQERQIAQSAAISRDTVPDRCVKPLIELNKSLFSHYRELIDQSRIANNWALLEAVVDDIDMRLSWASDYLAGSSLSELINSIEDGHYMTDEIVSVLATFIGGFFDVRTQSIQLGLRNFSRPVILAPSSRLIGPLFLIEAPVRDPNVLVKFPVNILPPNHNSNLPIPESGSVTVLRSILPLKLFHCIHVSVSSTELSQFTVSPFWMGCLGLVDRAIDKFVKASTEDPSPPLPGWDKVRYNLRGCHSKLSVASPLLVSCIADSDPFISNEVLELTFPKGLDLSLSADGLIWLKCVQSTLSLKSAHLYPLSSALNQIQSISNWDKKCFIGAFENFNALPVIKLTRTFLQLKLDVRNPFDQDPCDHWLVAPIVKTSLPFETDFEHFDSYRQFRSQSISFHLSGVVGDSSVREQEPREEIRLLYYREIERWIGRFFLTFHSDIDCVKQGPLHQCPAIPLRLHKTSFSNVFREIHLSFEFDDLFVSRLLNFSGIGKAQAIWATAQGSVLNMDWRKGQLDRHGREDWCYYYGEIEFLDVHFCVNSFDADIEIDGMNSVDFGVNIPSVVFYELLQAPRLFYLSLDEKCFQFDPESLHVQCTTISERRDSLMENFSCASKELNRCDPELDRNHYHRLVNTLIALQNRKRYFDSFLVKTNFDFGRSSYSMAEAQDNDLSDMSHFEVYNAQLVWHLYNRDIVFKLVDELFIHQKKNFSQNRNGLLLMRKLASKPRAQVYETDFQVQANSPPMSPRTYSSFCLSPNEAIDSFFETLLEHPAAIKSEEKGPFVAKAEPIHSHQNHGHYEKIDLRSPTMLRDPDAIFIPRIVEVNFYNPQLHIFTPTLSPGGSIVITAKQAKVEFSPLWDRHLYNHNLQKSENEVLDDEKIGTRTKISLKNSTFYAATSEDYSSWPSQVLTHCYLRDAVALEQILKRITEDSGVTLVYDVSNVGYIRTPNSPRLENFGHGDTISFVTNGLALTTKSEQFRAFLDVIVNLLVYRDPNQEIRSEKLETILIAANLSDRRTFALKMVEFKLKLDHLRQLIMNAKELNLTKLRFKDTLLEFDETERELAFLGEALRIIQASSEQLNQKRSRLTLKVDIDRIQWTMLMPISSAPTLSPGTFPICHVSLEGITNRWISKEDGSMENTFEIRAASFLNQLPNPFYRNVLKAFDLNDPNSGAKLKAAVNYGCLIRFFAKSRLPVNGVVILDHVELDLSPLQLQLTLDISQKIFKFFFPESFKKGKTSGEFESNSAEASTASKLARSNTITRRERSKTEVSLESSTLMALDGGDEAVVLKSRSQSNVFFVYVKVPASQHLLSYKGTGKTSIMDIDRFVLNLPEFEYQNKLWSWPEFFNQLRRDSLIVLLKNAGSLFKDKIKKFGRSNVPEDEQYIRNLARKEQIDLEVSDDTTISHPDTESKNFLVFGKSLLKLMKK